MKLPKGVKELSLKPYPGRLFLAANRKAYEEGHQALFRKPDMLTCSQGGRFSGGCGRDNKWTYIVWASKPAYLAHEFSHVILHTFDYCGIDPRQAGGEPFCYLLSQLLLDAGIE